MSDAKLLRDELRKKYLECGLEAMSDEEVVRLVLSLSCNQFDSFTEKLIEGFGSLKSIEDADPQALVRYSDIGERSAVLFRMVSEISRCLAVKNVKKGVYLRTTADAKSFFAPLFTDHREERLAVVCLSSRLKAVAPASVIAEGAAASVRASCRKITALALDLKADGVIIAHSHPSGKAVPSSGDYASTELLASALSRFGIVLIDHIIVAADDCVSLRETDIPLSFRERDCFGYKITKLL